MKTRDLMNLWREWLAASDSLLLALHEQTAAVTLRDVARVERLQPRIEELMGRVRELDGRASAAAKKLAGDLGVEPTLRGLVGALDKAEAQPLQAMANKIVVAAQRIDEVVVKNQKLIENEMTYINGTLTLIARAAVETRTPYRRRATAPVLVDQAA